jgi:hypothetical protein
MRAVFATGLLVCGGCDVAFDVTGYEAKCDLHPFSNNSSPRPIATALDFSMSEDASLLVGSTDAGFFEMTNDGAPAAVDLGIYPSVAFALSPEGDQLFLSSVADEPPRIQSEERLRDEHWAVVGHVPAGVYAGTPSAHRFGPRRVLVRIEQVVPGVQEYIESDIDTWVPTGPVLAIDTVFAPNLSPNALTMVYAGPDATNDNNESVFARQRDALDEEFGAPVLVLEGVHRAPQLSARCDALYSVDDGEHLVGYP